MAIIIVAGGGGSRLWPISTQKKPKQFVDIISDKSLLRSTYDNLTKEFDTNEIWVSTNKKYKYIVLDNLPNEFNADQLILEPEKRDSYAAVVSSAAIVANKLGKDEPLIFLPCDDYLSDERSINEFNKSQRQIEQEIRNKKFDVIIAGIKPTSPNTNYGYIELKESDKLEVFKEVKKVQSFKEKPDYETAKEYLESGKYLWNKFNFSFTYNSLAKVLYNVDKETLELLNILIDDATKIDEVFSEIEVNSFDYKVLENMSDNLGVLGLDIRWDDLGNWETVVKYLDNSSIQQIDGSNNNAITNNHKKIVFVGTSNLLAVETDEAILIVDPRNTKNIKNIMK